VSPSADSELQELVAVATELLSFVQSADDDRSLLSCEGQSIHTVAPAS
jgi:hypothetical protein